jgi:hypothetical protein
MQEILDTLIFLIPPFIAVALSTISFIAGFRHRRLLEGRAGWRIGTYLMALIVCYLSYRSLDDAGFVVCIIMGLIFAGFLWFMAMLPLLSQRDGVSR